MKRLNLTGLLFVLWVGLSVLLSSGFVTGLVVAQDDTTPLCDRGPVRGPSSEVFNLDQIADDWGIYCEGSPTGLVANVTTPAVDASALRLAITGGEPYSNVHFYRHFLPEPAATGFTLGLSFWFPSTTCNNQGSPSTIQALEFTMNKWQDGLRYEWAFQWENVGTGAPQWRYWDPHQPEPWVAFPAPITQCLDGATWHTLTFDGEIVNGQLVYSGFTVDGQPHPLNIVVNPFPVQSESDDRLAIAVQLDGNAAQTPYDVFVDQITFERRSEVSDGRTGGVSSGCTTSNAKARACPRFNCDILATIRSGTRLEIADRVQGDVYAGSTAWCLTRYNDQDVYVHCSLIGNTCPVSVCPNRGETGSGNPVEVPFNVPAGSVAYAGGWGYGPNRATVQYGGYLVTVTGPYTGTLVIHDGMWCEPVPVDGVSDVAQLRFVQRQCHNCSNTVSVP